MSDQSYDNIPSAASVTSDELDSLPSTSASTTSISPSEEEWQSDAEREWKESLQQLELLLTMVLVPYLGKYFGRKAAYWVTNLGLFKGIGAVEAAASLRSSILAIDIQSLETAEADV
ncbi:unnamed protein product [Aureobasidium mustum]|uniref:Uncharacterized protein n=1 Tax=Aureobasidium mustum TaxID=2773714 RepID=A0A9N8JSW4_9PEZI|nr:unnamed protein product [Aureobasidium mustum]